ncbi:MAG: hypothetical protein V7739_22115, partial [Motiliproteus sp.]
PTQAQSGWLIWAAQQILASDPLTALATGDFAPWANTHPINRTLQQRAIFSCSDSTLRQFSPVELEAYFDLSGPEG